jgi:hypothetical protein
LGSGRIWIEHGVFMKGKLNGDGLKEYFKEDGTTKYQKDDLGIW